MIQRLIVLGLVCGVALAQQPAPKPPRPPAEIVRSEWSDTLTTFGITREVFTTNNMSRLTSGEVIHVAWSIYIQGWSDALQAVQPACGPQGKDVDRSTVKLYVDIPDNAPSEIASGIRTRLRAMPDVKIVYAPEDADVDVAILAFEMKPKNSQTTLGYALSLVANRPCVLLLGGRSFNLQSTVSSILETAGNVGEMVEAVTADIDSTVCEKVRKWNESARKEQSASQK
jgi:hypothetical protein